MHLVIPYPVRVQMLKKGTNWSNWKGTNWSNWERSWKIGVKFRVPMKNRGQIESRDNLKKEVKMDIQCIPVNPLWVRTLHPLGVSCVGIPQGTIIETSDHVHQINHVDVVTCLCHCQYRDNRSLLKWLQAVVFQCKAVPLRFHLKFPHWEYIVSPCILFSPCTHAQSNQCVLVHKCCVQLSNKISMGQPYAERAQPDMGDRIGFLC